MNPFEWRGPEFLAFYLVFAAALLLWQWRRGREREREREGSAKPNLTDPYEIAYLRGGKNELLRVATISLVERCQLKVDAEGKVRTVAGKEKTFQADPVDAYLLDYYVAPDKAFRVLKAKPNDTLQRAITPYQIRLEAAGLLPDAVAQQGRRLDTAQTILSLAAVAGIKLALAIQQGRRNIGFLILLTMLAVVISLVLGFRRRLTPKGKRSIEDMQTLFGHMRDRPGLAPAELALTAAVFGMAVLPGLGVTYAQRLYPQGGAGSSCGGSSCGSSGGDSGGGSSCGGGSGCGGCGGGGD